MPPWTCRSQHQPPVRDWMLFLASARRGMSVPVVESYTSLQWMTHGILLILWPVGVVAVGWMMVCHVAGEGKSVSFNNLLNLHYNFDRQFIFS
jgi:hypothetical protein